MEEIVGYCLKLARMAVSAPSGYLRAANQRANCKVPLQISGDKQVQVSVVIIVEEAGAHVPAVGLEAGLPGDIRKGAIAVVSVKHAIAIVRH